MASRMPANGTPHNSDMFAPAKACSAANAGCEARVSVNAVTAARARVMRSDRLEKRHNGQPYQQNENRNKYQAGPEEIAEKARHADAALLRDGVDHEVGGVAYIGERAHVDRAHRDRRQGARERAHQ